MRRTQAFCVLALAVLLTALSGWKATQLERDDDLLAFLPQEHPKIVEFQEMAEAFGNTFNWSLLACSTLKWLPMRPFEVVSILFRRISKCFRVFSMWLV